MHINSPLNTCTHLNVKIEVEDLEIDEIILGIRMTTSMLSTISKQQRH